MIEPAHRLIADDAAIADDDLVVPCPAGLTEHAIAPLTRHGSRAYWETGSVTIEWTTAGGTFDHVALRTWLDMLAAGSAVISREALTLRIRDWLSARPGVVGVVVRTWWTGPGMQVFIGGVDAGPTR